MSRLCQRPRRVVAGLGLCLVMSLGAVVSSAQEAARASSGAGFSGSAGFAGGAGSAIAGDEAALRSVTFIDADRGWCAGDLGVILRSEDAGRNWQPVDSGTAANLNAIAMFNSQRGLAVGGSYEPYTQIGRGVVVLTEDGGQSWQPAGALTLPPLRQVLLGPQGRCIAAGDWSPIHGTNLFQSFDGGRTWEPLAGGGTGAVIALAGTVDDFLALDQRGELRRVVGEAAQQLIPPGRRWTALAGEGDWRWLSGPQANLVSTDRGATWHLAAAPPTGSANAGASGVAPSAGPALAASAACLLDGEVWALHAAGTTVVRHGAAEQGVIGERVAAASLRSLARLDRDRGWAVGDWGTILVTRDGGRTWRTVRGGDRRPAVMAVAAAGHQLPWSLLAAESQQHARRVAIVTARTAVTSEAAAEAGERDSAAELRVREAAGLIGPTAQHTWLPGKLPGKLPEQLPGEGSSGGAAAAASSDAAATAESEIAALLAVGVPAVLVLDQRLEPADKTLWTQLAIQQGVRRVFETGRPNGQTLHYAAPLPDAGKLAGDVWTDALAILQPGTLPPERLQLGARYDSVADHLATEGLAGCVGNDRRYVRPAQGGTSRRHLQVLQARSGEAAWIQSLVHSPEPLSQRMAQFEAALPRVAAENRQRLVMRILLASRAADQPELYRAMLRQAAQQWPDEPLGRLCDLQAQAIDASEEWQRLLASESFAAARNANAQVAAAQSVQWSPFHAVVPAVAAEPVDGPVPQGENGPPSGPELRRADAFSAQGGVQLAGAVEPPAPPPHRPAAPRDLMWQLHPAVLLARGTGNDLFSGPPEGSTGPRRADRWAELAQSARTAETVVAPWAAQRPLLNGDLAEPIWGQGRRFSLGHGQAAQLHVAYDDDFLYLAVRGPLLGDSPLGGDRERRGRDAMLDHAERYVIRLDVDGDLLTTFALEFDGVGNTRDTCDGFKHWQPRWFLAIDHQAGELVAEIAIQRSDLVGPLQQPDRAWNVSLTRCQPGEPAQPALSLSRPEGWRRLVFD